MEVPGSLRINYLLLIYIDAQGLRLGHELTSRQSLLLLLLLLHLHLRDLLFLLLPLFLKHLVLLAHVLPVPAELLDVALAFVHRVVVPVIGVVHLCMS